MRPTDSLQTRPRTRPRRRIGPMVWLAAAGPAAVICRSPPSPPCCEDVEFASLPGNQVEIDLVFSGAVPTAEDFATENPARIAIDFPGASSGLDKKSVPIGLGVAHSLVAVEASDRTRVVINLNDSVPYELKTRGNRVTDVAEPGALGAGADAGAAGGRAEVGEPPSRPRGARSRTSTFAAVPAARVGC
jgi:type IV pilus assembly protein PilQ